MSTVGINGTHDVGGVDIEASDMGEYSAKIDLTDKPNSYWESCIHALLVVLSTKKPSLASTDEIRRCVEGLEPKAYKDWGYYDKWSVALTTLLLERGVITQAEIDEELNGDAGSNSNTSEVMFKVGDLVRVRKEDSRLRWRRPHIRCPGYIYGQIGTVVEHVGAFDDPFLLAYRATGAKQHLYRVAFDMNALWGDIGAAAEVVSPPTGAADHKGRDEIQAEVYQGWLELVDATTTEPATKKARHHEESHHHDHAHQHHHEGDQHHTTLAATTATDLGQQKVASTEANTHSSYADSMEHEHSHEHGHDHVHEGRYEVECVAVDREAQDATRPGKVIGDALLRLLYRKGTITQAELHRAVEALESAGVNMKAADLVVYAWKDPAFKQRLLTDAPAAALERGIVTSNPNAVTVLHVMENTSTVHNVIVCTLCSCYPIGLLGFSPSWYKSRAYRSRVVREPRKVLSEFGLTLPVETSIRVHDSTADCRYFVLPLPPAHLSATDIAQVSHEELKKLVTRDSMVGVAVL